MAVRAGPTLHVTGHAKSLSIQSTLALGLCVCCYPFRLHEYVTGLLIPHLRAYPICPASPFLQRLRVPIPSISLTDSPRFRHWTASPWLGPVTGMMCGAVELCGWPILAAILRCHSCQRPCELRVETVLWNENLNCMARTIPEATSCRFIEMSTRHDVMKHLNIFNV